TIITQVLGAGELPSVHGVRPNLGILVTPETLLSHAPSDHPAADDNAERTRIRHLIERDEDIADCPDDEDEPPDVDHRRANPPIRGRPRPRAMRAPAPS